MSDAVRYDMVADRDAKFSEIVARVGVDWTGSAPRMQVRALADTTGTPLLDLYIGNGLAFGYTGVDTVAHHVASHGLSAAIYDLVNPVTGNKYAAGDSVAFSVIGIIVNASGMGNPPFPYPVERGDDWIGAYDLFVDPGTDGEAAVKQFYGAFTLKASVTIIP